MKATYLILGTLSFLAACAPNANFSSEDARFKSLMNGETVEMVDSDSLESILGNSSDETLSDDAGITMNDEPTKPEVVVVPSNNNGAANTVKNTNDDDDDSDDKKVDSSKNPNEDTKKRLVDQDKNEKYDEMVIAPSEVEQDPSISDVLSCGNGKGKNAKMYVCHLPSGDYSKRKTLCLPVTAVDAHLNHNDDKEHRDFAGACQGDDSNNLDSGKSSDNEAAQSSDSGATNTNKKDKEKSCSTL
jgi:hypothetical protein